MHTHLPLTDPRYSITGSNYPLNGKQRALLALVDELGPRFAARAKRYDREASFPFENYADLRQAGLLGLCVPEKFGVKSPAARSRRARPPRIPVGRRLSGISTSRGCR